VLAFGAGAAALVVVPFIERRGNRKAAMILTISGIFAIVYILAMTIAGYST
jgi:predicted exporter